MTDFSYSNHGLNGEPEHSGDVLCWCAPVVEHHPGGDVIVHNSLAEIILGCRLVERQIAMGEAAMIAQTWPDQPTAQIGRGWDEYAVATAIALAIRAATPALEVGQGCQDAEQENPR